MCVRALPGQRRRRRHVSSLSRLINLFSRLKSTLINRTSQSSRIPGDFKSFVSYSLGRTCYILHAKTVPRPKAYSTRIIYVYTHTHTRSCTFITRVADTSRRRNVHAQRQVLIRVRVFSASNRSDVALRNVPRSPCPRSRRRHERTVFIFSFPTVTAALGL